MVEFVLLAVVLLVPFAYVMVAVSEVQRASFAAAGASREAGRAFVTAPDGATAERRSRLAAAMAFEDQGVRAGHVLEIGCSAQPCLSPGERVTTEVRVVVPLPLVPTFGGALPAGIRVRAHHVEVVDAFVAARP
jgi:hypothetical protein